MNLCVFFSTALTTTKSSLEFEGHLIEFQTQDFKDVSSSINVFIII